MIRKMIKAENLVKRYGTNYALNDVSFEIAEGEEVRRVSLVPRAVSTDFIQTGRRTKTEERTPELMAHWTELKEGLAKTLIGLDIRQILQVH